MAGAEQGRLREAVRLRHHDALRAASPAGGGRAQRGDPRLAERGRPQGLRPGALRRRPHGHLRRCARHRRLQPARRVHQDGDRRGLRRGRGAREPVGQARRARREDAGRLPHGQGREGLVGLHAGEGLRRAGGTGGGRRCPQKKLEEIIVRRGISPAPAAPKQLRQGRTGRPPEGGSGDGEGRHRVRGRARRRGRGEGHRRVRGRPSGSTTARSSPRCRSSDHPGR